MWKIYTGVTFVMKHFSRGPNWTIILLGMPGENDTNAWSADVFSSICQYSRSIRNYTKEVRKKAVTIGHNTQTCLMFTCKTLEESKRQGAG
jgi:hypothetical protein